MLQLIAAVDENWGIGIKNQLLVRIPGDMRRFREMTTGAIVVMGRKTFESLPGGALADRTNIVLSRSKEFKAKGAMVARNLPALLEELHEIQEEEDQEIFIIGGEQIYKEFLPYCDVAHITKVSHSYEADAYLENLDAHPDWTLVERSEEQTYFDLEYFFLTYQRTGTLETPDIEGRDD